MIATLVGLALLAQTLVAPQAYTLADAAVTGVRADDQVVPALDLATQDGVYLIGLGAGCEGIGAELNVEVVYGTRDVAVINAVGGSEQACHIVFVKQVSAATCAQDALGVCDISAAEGTPQ